MLVALQIPLIDARPLTSASTGRTGAPGWPLPDINHREFVRGFGMVHRRPRGEVKGLRGEAFYANVARAIRVDQGKLVTSIKPLGQVRLAYRRMFCDGRVVARVEVGFAFRPRSGAQVTDDCLESMLNTPVRIHNPGSGEVADLPLWKAGQQLARSYLSATTSRKPAPPTPAKWWVTDGEPVIFVERTQAWGEAPDAQALCAVTPFLGQLEQREATNSSIGRRMLTLSGQQLSVWTLSLDARSSRLHRVTVGRRVRGHVLRLQAELEALKSVLRLVRAKVLAVDADRSTEFERYLQDASGLLLRDSLGGFPQGSVFDELASTAAVVPIEARDEITERLTSLGTTVKSKVGKLFSTGRGNLILEGMTSVNADIIEHLTVIAPAGDIQPGGVTMNDQSKTITIGSDAVVNAPIAIADSIQDSFNTAAQSRASDEVKAALEQLLRAVAELSKTLPPAQAREVARDAGALTQEVTSESPRRKFWELSLDGLKEAAESVGAIGSPVVAAVKLLAGLLVP